MSIVLAVIATLNIASNGWATVFATSERDKHRAELLAVLWTIVLAIATR